MSKIKSQKVITIFGHCGNDVNTFTYTINNLEFIPDVCILKHTARYDNNSSPPDALLMLSTDLIESRILFCYPALSSLSQAVDIPFKMNGPVHGTYNFIYTRPSGALPTSLSTFDCIVSLTFLFIKYEEEKK